MNTEAALRAQLAEARDLVGWALALLPSSPGKEAAEIIMAGWAAEKTEGERQ